MNNQENLDIPHPDPVWKMDKYSIKQRREFIKDTILDAKPNTVTTLVCHSKREIMLLNKAFTKGLKSKAAAKNFTLEFAVYTA
ncbi:hypothetical protein [Nostoc sp. 'Peltigera membranacea cyanobiont' 232]|uniref:hypothetical protein n=1 Tax=Nostoc sp. 'Peltigera membranacea cyanobiont' 232 TaxID=2014531 RepID=UPI000B95B564|nr:hypothetical protein [Nostoc sp. 'Peltigera membranacea cyanobiont' 232]OYD99782.1 hypothetical protein CDG79_38940 [Nostoc sp. 'Peltigera membranacea cyanobiont' 232]